MALEVSIRTILSVGRVIRSKYGMKPNGWDSNLETWGSFRNPWEFISQGLNVFLQNTKMRVEDVTKFLFWRDKWREKFCFRVYSEY